LQIYYYILFYQPLYRLQQLFEDFSHNTFFAESIEQEKNSPLPD